jgi:hypothetical protein
MPHTRVGPPSNLARVESDVGGTSLPRHQLFSEDNSAADPSLYLLRFRPAFEALPSFAVCGEFKMLAVSSRAERAP